MAQQVEISGAAPPRFMATEPATKRYLTGNTCPGWEITPFISSAKLFDRAEDAAAAAEPVNAKGRQFVVIPAAVFA